MIPRYQKVILWVLLVSSVLMAAYLIRMRARAQDRLAAIPDSAPMPIPVEAAPVQVTLLFANDEDGSLAPVEQEFALPAETTTRARTLLNDLFAEYAKPDSPHPLAPVVAVDDVFLLPVPESNAAHPQQMAVINLDGSFVDHHPSGNSGGEPDLAFDLRNAAREFSANCAGTISGRWTSERNAGRPCRPEPNVSDRERCSWSDRLPGREPRPRNSRSRANHDRLQTRFALACSILDLAA